MTKLSFLWLMSVRKISVASSKYLLVTTLWVSWLCGRHVLVDGVCDKRDIDNERDPLPGHKEQRGEEGMRTHLWERKLCVSLWLPARVKRTWFSFEHKSIGLM